MSLVAAAAITVVGSLVSSFIQNWANDEAEEEAKKEARRTEALNIKFAEKENERLGYEFTRTHGLEKRKFAAQQAQTRVNNTQNVIKSIVDMMNNNSQARQMYINLNRQR